MIKFWRVLAYEYRKNVFTKGFVIMCITIPLVMALSILISFLTNRAKNNDNPIGYVDDSGFLSDPLPPADLAGPEEDGRKLIEIKAYPNKEEAEAALRNGEVQAFYWFPEDYSENRYVQLFYEKEPGPNATRFFWDYVQLHWVRDLPEEVAYRAVAGRELTARSLDGMVEVSDQAGLNPFIPLILAFFFYIIVMANSQSMMEAVVKEKENRTMEVLVTSLSTNKLIAGKLLGTILMLLTLAFIWVSVGVLAINIGGKYLDLQFLQHVTIQPHVAISLLLVMVPALVIVNALVVTLAASIVEVQEGQQLAVMIAMAFYLPIVLIVPLVENPDSILAQVMMFIPFTAPFTTALRLMTIQIPWWQLLSSTAILCGSAWFFIWLAQMTFAMGMLRYGQKLKLSDILKVIKRPQRRSLGKEVQGE